MINEIELAAINKKLKQVFGASQDGRANWRLIWSESEDGTEYRRGAFNRFSDDGRNGGAANFENFTKEEIGVFKERKYPWLSERYLLEQLIYQPNPDIPQSRNGHYELRYITQDGQGRFLPPKYEVYEAIIYFLISGKAQAKTDWSAYFERESKEYKQWAKNMMEENFPLIAHQVQAGEASFVPSTYGNQPVNVLKSKDKVNG